MEGLEKERREKENITDIEFQYVRSLSHLIQKKAM